MAKDQLDHFIEELRKFHEQETRRMFSQTQTTVPPASITAAHQAIARMAQAIRRGGGAEAEAVILAHRAFAIWLAGSSAIGDPQGKLFPDDGVTAEEVTEMVETENARIEELTRDLEDEEDEEEVAELIDRVEPQTAHGWSVDVPPQKEVTEQEDAPGWSKG